MEYEGIIIEFVASGIKGGSTIKGSTSGSTSATGAGAAFLDFFFLGFLPPIIAPAPARQQHNSKRAIHSQIGSWEPKEPDALEPELADPEASLAQDP